MITILSIIVVQIYYYRYTFNIVKIYVRNDNRLFNKKNSHDIGMFSLYITVLINIKGI